MTAAAPACFGASASAAYRKYMRECNVLVQFCMAHLIRDVKFRLTLPGKDDQAYGRRLRDTLRELFGVIHQHETMTPHRHAAQLTQVLTWLRQADTGGGPRRITLAVGRDGVMLPIIGSQKYREAATGIVAMHQGSLAKFAGRDRLDDRSAAVGRIGSIGVLVNRASHRSIPANKHRRGFLLAPLYREPEEHCEQSLLARPPPP